jgi:hypothetical protein
LDVLQSDQSKLTGDQWNLLSNLVHCYDEYNGLSLAKHFVSEQNSLPLKLRFKSSSLHKFIASLMNESQLLFKKNPHFLSLCSHDRSILLHCITKYITMLGSSFTVRQAQLIDHPSYIQSIESLFGSTTMIILRHLIDRLEFDVTFIKLVLSILSFSTINYTIYTNTDPINLINIKTIIHIHDTYTELAWQYLIYKYDHRQAIIYFSKLVSCLLTLNAILVEVHEEKSFRDITDSIVEQTEQTLALNH